VFSALNPAIKLVGAQSDSLASIAQLHGHGSSVTPHIVLTPTEQSKSLIPIFAIFISTLAVVFLRLT